MLSFSLGLFTLLLYFVKTNSKSGTDLRLDVSTSRQGVMALYMSLQVVGFGAHSSSTMVMPGFFIWY